MRTATVLHSLRHSRLRLRIAMQPCRVRLIWNPDVAVSHGQGRDRRFPAGASAVT